MKGMREFLAVGAAVLVAGAAVAPAVATSDTAASLDLADLVPPLAEESTAADALPDSVVSSDTARSMLDVSTARYLGHGATAEHWVVLNNDGEVCLLSATMEGEVAGHTCTEPLHFYRHGLALSVYGAEQVPGPIDAAYLLPADVTISGQLRSMAQSVSENYGSLVILSSGDEVREIDLQRSGGGTFEFTTLPEPDFKP